MLPPGTSLGPYQILAPLGAGGMGEVYRARDTRLGRDVALKVIPAELARDPDRIKRFEQEARAAGALNHPNVCAIHDLGTHEGSPFVVMELLEGESLRQRITAGPIPARKAIDYAAQAAQGLAAAHDKGIVHRDLKPENLFVTKDGRVKVLDFGLAKLTRPEVLEPAGEKPDSVAATQTGAILGTVGYMAPEQVRGQAADHRSDLFALGAILYELLTGKRAFHGASYVETLHAILNQEPAPLSASGRDLPPGLETIVRHCLEKSPDERFQSARDLAFNLQAAGGASVEITAVAAPTKTAARRPRPRAGVVALTAGVLIAAGTAAFLWWRGRTSAPSTALEPKRIVVAVFENETGEGSLDPLGRMTSDWITQGMSRVEGLEVVPSTSVLYVQPAGAPRAAGADPIRALAKETGAGTVVSGAYYLQGDTLRFQARITDAVHGTLLQALDPVSGTRSAPLEAIDALRQRVMGAVAASLEAVHEMGTQQRPPRYDAYREFIAGFEVFDTDDPEALRHFERAAALDPEFLTPLFYEAYLRDEAGDHTRVAEILRTLSARREQLPPFGRRWLDVMLAYAGHRYAEALQHTRAALRVAPRDPMTNLWVGYMAVLSNRPQEGLDTYRQFGARPYPDHALGAAWMIHLCSALHRLGQHQRELEEAHRARTAHPEQPGLWTLEADALGALGRAARVNQLLDERLAEAPTQGTSGNMMLEAAAELRAHGQRQASLAVANRAVAWYRSGLGSESDSSAWLPGLVDALRWAERWEEAAAVCRNLVQRSPQNPDYLGILGGLAARLGKRDEAVRIAEQLRQMNGSYLFGAHTYWRACIAALLGDRQGAVDLLRESFAEGKRFGLGVHREIDFESLRDYAPFRDLLRPRG
jgi:tetratricopeptide (TPR) repeat protein